MNQREKATRKVSDVLCKLPARKRDVRAVMNIAIDLQVELDQNWIDVKQELPPKGVSCLVAGARAYGIAKMMPDGYWWGSTAHNDITHWQTLPSLPLTTPTEKSEG